jgi:hypothetical protein
VLSGSSCDHSYTTITTINNIMAKASAKWMENGRDVESDHDQGYGAAAVREERQADGSCSKLQQMTEKIRKPVRYACW